MPAAGSARPTTRTRSASRTTAVEVRPCTVILTLVSLPCTAFWVVAHVAAYCGTGGGGTCAGGFAMT
ncbi:hypothetical protein [Streptomyces resistomycificus]|uniref:hypothetical protein n=1 Tax=Streptomyces resistomycificus TaxID=67356 RepID=UPI00068E1B7C